VGFLIPANPGAAGAGEGKPDAGQFRAVLTGAGGQRLTGAAFFSLGTDPAGTGLLLGAIIGIPCTAKPGRLLIRIEKGSELIGEIPLTIENRDFTAEEITLDQANTEIRTLPDPQKTREAEQLWAILNHTGGEIYAEGSFVPPVTSTRRTSFYGDRRIYRYSNGKSDTSIHGGVDYGVPRGTPVTACAPGKVILARFRIVTGNSVILEHYPGVYSLYYHLNSIRVTEGAMVTGGSILGESGSTGLATGPHLHWEIRVSGENTDPDAFISRPILDKAAILHKLTEE
jgi:murein DD-endopeptidase MepM/ murein hydrolase activator NlpD